MSYSGVVVLQVISPTALVLYLSLLVKGYGGVSFGIFPEVRCWC